MDSGPIFIGGLSFSGKTPLRLMLSSHPRIVITRRTYMWPRFYGRFGDLSRRDNFERCLEAMLQFKHTHNLQPDARRIRQEFWQGPPTYSRLFGLFHEHFAARMGKPRWGDQLGGVEQFADPILAAYPSGQMIHMIRDPRERFKASLVAVPGRKGKAGWEAAQWRHSVRLATRNQQCYPGRYKVVQYERLLASPEETLRDICSFLDESFVSAMLTMEGAFRMGDDEEKRNTRLPAPGQETGVSISGSDLAFIQLYTRREMLAFNYQPALIHLSPQEWPELCLRWLFNLAGSTVRPVRGRNKIIRRE
jgi:hypothetical protein